MRLLPREQNSCLRLRRPPPRTLTSFELMTSLTSSGSVLPPIVDLAVYPRPRTKLPIVAPFLTHQKQASICLRCHAKRQNFGMTSPEPITVTRTVVIARATICASRHRLSVPNRLRSAIGGLRSPAGGRTVDMAAGREPRTSSEVVQETDATSFDATDDDE